MSSSELMNLVTRPFQAAPSLPSLLLPVPVFLLPLLLMQEEEPQQGGDGQAEGEGPLDRRVER